LVGGTVAQIRETLIPVVKSGLEAARDSNCSGKDDKVWNIVVVLCGLNDWKTLYTEFPSGSGPVSFKQDLELLVSDINGSAGRFSHIYLPALPITLCTGFQTPPLKYIVNIVAGIWDKQKRHLTFNEEESNTQTNIKHVMLRQTATNPKVGHGSIYIDVPADGYISKHLDNTVDDMEIPITKEDLIHIDGIHPSSSGYRLWALHVADEIVVNIKQKCAFDVQ
jgi:hypothetical protein